MKILAGFLVWKIGHSRVRAMERGGTRECKRMRKRKRWGI